MASHASNPALHHNSPGCIKNLEFFSTTNGGGEHNKTKGVAATGDCMVIAGSIATGLSYAETERRLTLLAKSLKKHREALAAVPEANLSLYVPEEIADRNPVHGTNVLTCILFLKAHFFDERSKYHCLCDKETPCVITGVTDDGSYHAVAVQNGQAYGMYDVTAKDFEIDQVWELNRQLASDMGPFYQKYFANQRQVNALVKRWILPAQ